MAEDEYEIPLRDQRFFGAGIKRKRIQFVPSSSQHESAQSLPSTPSTSVADRYRGLVLKKTKNAADQRASSAPPQNGEGVERTCDICGRPVSAKDSSQRHQSSIAHQICLQHSHPPSHIDRSRKGLAVLESHGWDPDGRKGLGIEGQEGILHPIKAQENPERAGLGMKAADLGKKAAPKPVKLDAGKVKWMEGESKKKAARLRDAFYRSEDVERYLGEGKEGWR